nr:MAG TPA: hypothetical protein [Caudoviricetes sp.]
MFIIIKSPQLKKNSIPSICTLKCRIRLFDFFF